MSAGCRRCAEDAVRTDERFGADGLLLRSRQWLAVALRGRNSAGNAERAVVELTRMVTEARRLGHQLVADECQRLLEG